MMTSVNEKLFAFIKKSPCSFFAVETMKTMLKEHGYEEIRESEAWHLEKGKGYFTIRNGSSIIAFSLPENESDYHYQITSSHSDSPTFKVKEKADCKGNGYVQLNVEGYGGMLCSTWLDRPLSLCGRVLVKEGNSIVTKWLNVDKDLVMIPNLAIHMNREANQGMAYNNQVDMLPLLSLEEGVSYDDLLAEELKVAKEDIIGTDVYLYNRQEATIWGAKEEFIASPRLDDLQCAYTSLEAFLQSKGKAITVFSCFDNEEVGSQTKQGAASTFLMDVLKRINGALGYGEEEYCQAVAKSFMVSCDNAHAIHPNHPEKSDKNNACYLNQGIVIKHSANQKYTSDAFSSALFTKLCENANAKVQHFSNRSDMVGGSTLGNISATQVSLHTVDVGLAQLAMHSSYECAGAYDSEEMIKALTYFYNVDVRIHDYDKVEVIE